jgi:hypothetical protein
MVAVQGATQDCMYLTLRQDTGLKIEGMNPGMFMLLTLTFAKVGMCVCAI